MRSITSIETDTRKVLKINKNILIVGAFVIVGIILSQSWTNFFGDTRILNQEIKRREQADDSLLILHTHIGFIRDSAKTATINYEKHMQERDSIIMLESKPEHIGAITRFLNR